jgi:CubicO group peptidase (beta-lactamase class C family)
MTAAAALALEDEGVLQVDERPAADYVPEIGERRTTLRHLLTNTSGIKDDEDLLWLAGVTDETPSTTAEHVSTALAEKREFAPGAHCRYSNAGFRVAALALESAAGRSFPEVMQDALFGPLGLRKTRVRSDPAEVIPGMPGDYRVTGDGFKRFFFQRQTTGDGGVVSTLEELLTWGEAVRTNSLPIRAGLERLTRAPVLSNGQASPYAHGLCLLDHRGQRVWAHGGTIGCFHSELAILPDAEAVVVIFTNRSDANPRRMLRRLLDGSSLGRGGEGETPRIDLVPGRYVAEDAGLAAEVRRDDKGDTELLLGPLTYGTGLSSSGARLADGYTSDTIQPQGLGFILKGPEQVAFRMPDGPAVGNTEGLAGRYRVRSVSTDLILRVVGPKVELHLGRGHHPSQVVRLAAAASEVWTGGRLVGMRVVRNPSGGVNELRLHLPEARNIRATRID